VGKKIDGDSTITFAPCYMYYSHNYKSITELARELRKNPTNSEKVMWELLRKRRFEGLKFLRQFPIIHEQIGSQRFFYIADFYCAEKRLIIELDGPIHLQRKEYDSNRDDVLKNLGFHVLRINNEEVKEAEEVLLKIRQFLTDPSLSLP